MAILVRHREQGHFFADLRCRASRLGRFQAIDECVNLGAEVGSL